MDDVEFAMKFQQLTGPVTAKGIEDTAFYNYNRLLSLNFTSDSHVPNPNATIDIGGVLGRVPPFTFNAAGLQSATFTVHRQTAGQGTTVPLVVTDGCGQWPTVVGGGPNAF